MTTVNKSYTCATLDELLKIVSALQGKDSVTMINASIHINRETKSESFTAQWAELEDLPA